MKTKEHKDLKRAEKKGASRKYVCDKYYNFLQTHRAAGLNTGPFSACPGVNSCTAKSLWVEMCVLGRKTVSHLQTGSKERFTLI